jgi:hypothetical protein
MANNVTIYPSGNTNNTNPHIVFSDGNKGVVMEMTDSVGLKIYISGSTDYLAIDDSSTPINVVGLSDFDAGLQVNSTLVVDAKLGWTRY